MKKLVVISSMILFVVATAFAIPRNSNTSKITSSRSVAYTVNVPDKVVDGKFYAGQSIDIERIPAEHVYQNMIEIKTKEYLNFDEKTSRFENNILQADLDKINSKRIRAPYASYFSGNQMLRADKFGLSRIFEVRYDGNHDPYDICKILLENPEVEYATPVFKRYQYGFIPNDQWYGIQYHHNLIKMSDAWEITKGDTNIVIAIVDSGTDIDHEDLKANIWTNPREIPNNGKDDDGNGKIDDVHGWDFIGNISRAQYQNGQFKPNNNPTSKLNTHGTHTAGCASAVTNNGTGVAAPGYNCRIMPIKCASDSFESPGITSGYEGILYAAVTGANIINCSWGGAGMSLSELDVVNQAISLGALIVAASGNSGKNIDVSSDYPAAFNGVMSVGSSGAKDLASNFSNYGNIVRVMLSQR